MGTELSDMDRAALLVELGAGGAAPPPPPAPGEMSRVEMLAELEQTQSQATRQALGLPEAGASGPGVLETALQLTAGPQGLEGAAPKAAGAAPAVLGTAGGIAGGVAGSAIGNPGLGIIAGSSLGAAGGTLIKQALRPGEVSLAESAADIMLDGVVSEAAGLGVSKVGNKLFRRFVGEAVVGVKEANILLKEVHADLRERAIAKGVTPEEADRVVAQALRPAEATEGRLLDTIQQIAEGSIFGDKTANYARVRDIFLEELAGLYTDVLARVAGPDEVGRMLVANLKAGRAVTKGRISHIEDIIADQMSATITPLKPDVRPPGMRFRLNKPNHPLQEGPRKVVDRTGGKSGLVFVGHMRRALGRERAEILDIGAKVLDADGLSRLTRDLDTIANAEHITFTTAKNLRRRIDSLTAKAANSLDPNATFVAAGTELRGTLTTAMENAVKRFDKTRRAQGFQGSDMFTLWKSSQKAWAEFYDSANSVLVRGLIRNVDQLGNGPKVIADILPKNNATQINEIADIIGRETPEWKSLQAWHLDDVFTRSQVDEVGPPLGKRFLANLTGRNGIGKDAAEALYGKKLLTKYEKLGNALELQQRKNRVPGSMGIQFMEMGTAVSAPGVLLSGNAKAKGILGKTAVAIIVTSKTLNRWLTNPATVDAVIDGVLFGSKTREGSAAVTRLIATLGKDEFLSSLESVTPEEYKEFFQP